LRAVLARKCPRDLVQLDRLLAITKDLGPPFMLGKAARVADSELYELRTHRGARVFWLYGPRESVILLCGYRKQTVGMPRHELARAEAWADALAQNDPKSLISVVRPFRSATVQSACALQSTSALAPRRQLNTLEHENASFHGRLSSCSPATGDYLRTVRGGDWLNDVGDQRI
jgi:hypothetical protein